MSQSRVVLITGAAGGVGQALCKAFLDLGDIVVALDRAAEALDALARNLGVSRLDTCVADVTDLEALRRIASQVAARHGGIHVAIANAGGVASEFAGDMFDSWRADVDLNLNGAAFTVEAVRPFMEEAGGGAVVLIGSVNGLTFAGHPAYSAAKAALVGHTRTLACLLGPKNIRINLLAPGTVRTPAWEARLARDPDVLEKVTRWYPLGRVCMPQDVANVAVFLASEAARMVHGAVLPVDGGLTAGNMVFASEIS